MKKFFWVLCLCFCCVFMLSGCGVSGGSSIIAIRFERQIYYVDENCDTKIDYKVYPSTADNFATTFQSSSEDYFTLNGDGIINVENFFSSVKLTVQAGNKTDECYVVKKIYPSSVYLTHPCLENKKPNSTDSLVLTKGASTAVTMFGEFGARFNQESGKTEVISNADERLQIVDENIFKFEVVSSDPSIVNVPDPSKLQIASGSRTGDCVVSVFLVDDNGQRKQGAGGDIYASINVSVIEPVAKMRIFYKIGDGHLREITDANFSTITNTGTSAVKVDFYIMLVDENGGVIESESALNSIIATAFPDKDFKPIENRPTETISCDDAPKCYNDDGNVKFGVKVCKASFYLYSSSKDRLVFSCKFVQGENQKQISSLIYL